MIKLTKMYEITEKCTVNEFYDQNKKKKVCVIV